MAEALDLSSSDYSLAVSIFFIGYLLLEVPSNMILNRTRPSLYLPGLMVSHAFLGVTGTILNITDCLGRHGVSDSPLKEVELSGVTII